MKREDFDFRLYVVKANDYVRDEDKYQILADLNEKSEFMERLELKQPEVEIELFTRLYDKNKSKIYEGDILLHSRQSVYKPNVLCVVYDDGEKLNIKAINKKEQGFIVGLPLSVICESSKIMGNIHKNSELLRGAKWLNG